MYLQVVCLSLRTNCKYPQFCLHTVESYFQDLQQRVGEVAETKIGFRHSGFTFSHYELPFPTRDCNPWAAVTSALYQPCHSRQGNSCVRAPLHSRSYLVFALHSKFGPSVWTPRLRGSSFWYR